jgi:predicted nucleic acid-binding protein
MNDWLVVDASVVIKAFVSEDGSEAAAAIWSSEANLAAPAHALAEVGEALRRKLARGEISDLQMSEACLALPGSFVSISLDSLFGPAMEISRSLSVGFYDALYIAAAERHDCRLATADLRLLGATKGSVWEGRLVKLEAFAG